MTIKPVLVPDHDAATLRRLMDQFAAASTGPTRQQLAESQAAVAAASKKKNISEGFMDTVKQAFNDLVVGYPQGTSEGQFIQGWARAIRAETGRDIPLEKLTKLYHDYAERSEEIMQSHGTTNEGVAEGSYKDTSGTFMDRVVGEIMNYQSLNNANPKFADLSSAVKSKLKSLGEIKAKQIYQQALKQAAKLSGQQGVAEGSDDSGAYDKWDPKHPDFVKNYRKFQARNPGATLKDFVADLKKGVTEIWSPMDDDDKVDAINAANPPKRYTPPSTPYTPTKYHTYPRNKAVASNISGEDSAAYDRFTGRDKEQDVAEGSEQQLNIQQLATISDEALDNEYHYGRSTPGNTFGWQANLKSAAYAKQMIDRGVTDIEAISDAIHKGWNVTARAFVQNPDQFDDRKNETIKFQKKFPDKSPEEIAQEVDALIEKKRGQRSTLMNTGYSQLSNDEQEKDRVVARALLQALKGPQGVTEGMLTHRDFEKPDDADVLKMAKLAARGLLTYAAKTKMNPANLLKKDYYALAAMLEKINPNLYATIDGQLSDNDYNWLYFKAADLAAKSGVTEAAGMYGDEEVSWEKGGRRAPTGAFRNPAAEEMPVNKYIAQELDTLLKLAQDQVDDIVNRSRDGYGNKKSSGLEDAIFELSGVSNGFHSSQEEGVAELQELMSGLPRIGNWIMRNLKKVGNQIDLPQLIQSETSKKSGVTEAGRPDVMRHRGDTTVKVVKRAGKPIGEIGIDAEASEGNGAYYVKLYDGSYDAVGFDTAEEALAELKYAIKSAGSGPDTSFGGPGGWTGPVGEMSELRSGVDEGLKQKLAGAALAGAMALGAGGAQAQSTDRFDPAWGTSGYNTSIRSDVSSNKSMNTADPSKDTNDFQKRIQSVTGPNAKGEYKVVVMQGHDIVSHYVTKTPPPEWLYKEDAESKTDEGIIDNIKNTVRAANYDRLARRSNSQAVAGGGLAPPAQFRALSAKGDQRAQKAQDIRKGDVAESVDPIEQLRADIRRFSR